MPLGSSAGATTGSRPRSAVGCASGAEVADRRVTTSQSRPPWGGEGDWISTPVARFRCTRATGLWSLYWADRNSRFHEYDRFQPTRAVQGVLDVLDTCQDPILWG